MDSARRRLLAFGLAACTVTAAWALDLERPARDVRIADGRIELDAQTICARSETYGRHCVVANAAYDDVVFVGLGAATVAPAAAVIATGVSDAAFTFRDGRNGGRLPAVFAHYGTNAFDTAALVSRNALGVTTFAPVRFVRVDPVEATEPWVLAGIGSEAVGVELARLVVAAVRALPADVRRRANEDGMTALTAAALLRRAQRDVKTDDDWLSGDAHRPVLDPKTIDERRLGALASGRREYVVPPPAILCRDLEISGGSVPIVRNVGAMACRFVLEPGENEVRVIVKADTVGYAKPRWVVLQGDGANVRVEPTGRGYEAKVSIDWKGPYEIRRGRGRVFATRRVDVGCFAVAGQGEISLPAVCSFYFKP